MAAGLAALMGILGGTGGLPEGMIAGDKQRLAEEHLAEAKRHAGVVEGGLNTPISSLYKTIGLPVPEGVDETASVPTSLASHAYGAIEKEQGRKDTAARRSILDEALGKAATDFGGPATIDRSAPGMSEPEAAGTPAPIKPGAPHPGISLLRQVIPGLDPEKVTPAVTELIKELNPGGGKINTNVVQGAEGSWLVGHDAKGNVVNKTDLGLGIPEGRNAQIQIAKKALEAEYKTGKFQYAPGTPEHTIELNRRIERMMIAPPGADVIPQRSLPGGAPVAAPAPPAGTPPGAVWRNAPAVSEGTASGYAAGKMAVEHMESLANDIERLLPDSKTRVSVAFRQMLNNVPIANASPQVSPDEQDIITRLQHLQLRYESAMGGLRAAGSPQFYDRMKSIFGGVDKATVGSGLRSLAGELRGFLENLSEVEGSQGKRPLPAVAPKPATAAPAAAQAPWTDLGGGVRIREKR